MADAHKLMTLIRAAEPDAWAGETADRLAGGLAGARRIVLT